MTQTNLLPCPFCSGAGELKHFEGWHYVECGSCHCAPYKTNKPEAAIAKWNTRHTPKRELVVNNDNNKCIDDVIRAYADCSVSIGVFGGNSGECGKRFSFLEPD